MAFKLWKFLRNTAGFHRIYFNVTTSHRKSYEKWSEIIKSDLFEANDHYYILASSLFRWVNRLWYHKAGHFPSFTVPRNRSLLPWKAEVKIRWTAVKRRAGRPDVLGAARGPTWCPTVLQTGFGQLPLWEKLLSWNLRKYFQQTLPACVLLLLTVMRTRSQSWDFW